MLLKFSRTNWGLFPLLFSILNLLGCGTLHFSPSVGSSTIPSASESSSKPIASVSPSLKSSITTASPSSISTGDEAKGVKSKDGQCPKGEPVKGEIGKHKKVYHLPDSKDYDKVKPATCFTSVIEAKKAGFRAPRTISEFLQEHLKDAK